MPGIFVIREISAMYSVPSLKATPLGSSRPLAITFTSRWPPLSTTAYTLPATRLDTNSVPLSPHVIARALLMPWAHSSAWKPGGSLILAMGISPGAFGDGGWAIGARVESAIEAGWPCFQGGGACPDEGGAATSPTPSSPASNEGARRNRNGERIRRMVSLLHEDRRV